MGLSELSKKTFDFSRGMNCAPPYKYRLYPTSDQEQALSDVCFLCSLVYNRCLAERIQVYKQTGKSPSCYDQIKSLPGWEKDGAFVDSLATAAG